MPKELLRDQVKATWLKTRDQAEKKQSVSINEADTRAVFIDPLIEALGWDRFEDIERERQIPHSGERVDYVLKIGGDDTMFVEAKSLHAPLAEKDIVQVLNYANIAGVRWCLLTNGIRLRLYDQFNPEELKRKFVFEVDLSKSEEEYFSEIFSPLWLISKEAIAQGELDLYVRGLETQNHIRELSAHENSSLIRFLEKELKNRVKGQVNRQEIRDVLSQMLLGERPGVSRQGVAVKVALPPKHSVATVSAQWTEDELGDYLEGHREWHPLTYTYYKFLASYPGKVPRGELINSLTKIMGQPITGYSLAGVRAGITATVTKKFGKESLDWVSEDSQEFSIAEKYRSLIQRLTGPPR